MAVLLIGKRKCRQRRSLFRCLEAASFIGKHKFRQRCSLVGCLNECKSGLLLLLPQSLAGKLDVKAVAAKGRLLNKSSAFGHKAKSSLIINKAFIGGLLIEEALAISGRRQMSRR